MINDVLKYDWTPAMDLAIIDPVTGKYPKNYRDNPLVAHIKDSTIKKRRRYLKQNFWDVGWGDLIGTSKIETTDSITGEENVW